MIGKQKSLWVLIRKMQRRNWSEGRINYH